MTLPSVGTRVVSVGAERFRWRLRARSTSASREGRKPMLLAVERIVPPGSSLLLVDLGVTRPDETTAPHQTSVTPRLVREIIAEALALRWDPGASGRFDHHHPLVRDRA